MKIRLLVPVYVTVEAPGFSKALGDQAVEVIADSHPNPETLAFGEVTQVSERELRTAWQGRRPRRG